MRLNDWVIENGSVLRDGEMTQTPLSIEAGHVTDMSPATARRFDATGCYVLPGIVDVHGDGFERVVNPRPGVSFALPLALEEADRQMIANGITTAYHGLTASWEPGERSVGAARAFLAGLDTARPRLDCDTRVNLRWEAFCLDDLEEIAGWVETRPDILLSLNDHLSAYLKHDETSKKIARMADRTGLSRADCIAAVHRQNARRGEVPAAIARMTEAALNAGRMIFAHDEMTPEERRTNRALGVTTSEFPMSRDTAAEAIAAGEPVILGAPNVVRGGSQNNAIGAEESIAEGLCTALTSDYYYPALFHAAFTLADRGTLPLAGAWALVSSGPARAAGLTDRGTLGMGQRADMIVVDRASRRLRAVFVAGRKVLDRE
ncbi:alpha-D-ribose 1-methylphosphonate 5-triphosphate diphosphatase [Pseudooceanicola sp. C21-150M6]|uniref:alpha-D-ribose 1-methylphosphonate 5-triphosphate diphosphatase n=1 Tax=Pseudooceanicola sp. C21-150M6 TaxID=3434355 RepID=UPI003D7FFA5F